MSTRFGLSAALTTPFEETGGISLATMTSHARRCLQAGCDSVTLFGTTGEGSSIGAAERSEAISAFLDAGIPGGKLVVGVMANAIQDAAAQARQALEANARNVLLAPPSYFKNVSDDGLFDWYSRVFEALGPVARGIIVYNIPSVTMVKLSVDLLSRLRRAFPEVVAGMKDSGGEWAHTERLLEEHRDLLILVGDERHLAQGTRLGGQGAISGLANVLPAQVRAMAVDGKDDQRVVDLVAGILQFPVTPAVKVLVARVVEDAIWLNVRPPLEAIGREGRDRINLLFDDIFAMRRTG